MYAQMKAAIHYSGQITVTAVPATTASASSAAAPVPAATQSAAVAAPAAPAVPVASPAVGPTVTSIPAVSVVAAPPKPAESTRSKQKAELSDDTGVSLRGEDMKCTNCGSERVIKAPIEVTRHFGTESFIGEIRGARRCEACGATFTPAQALGKLERAIATKLAESGAHSPEAVKFMRKMAGLKSNALASLLGVKPETVSRWESGAPPLGSPKPSRFRVATGRPRPRLQRLRERLMDLLALHRRDVPRAHDQPVTVNQIVLTHRGPALAKVLVKDRQTLLGRAVVRKATDLDLGVICQGDAAVLRRSASELAHWTQGRDALHLNALSGQERLHAFNLDQRFGWH